MFISSVVLFLISTCDRRNWFQFLSFAAPSEPDILNDQKDSKNSGKVFVFASDFYQRKRMIYDRRIRHGVSDSCFNNNELESFPFRAEIHNESADPPHCSSQMHFSPSFKKQKANEKEKEMN